MGVAPPDTIAYQGCDPHKWGKADASTPPGASENRPGANFAQSNLARSNFEAAGGARAVSFAGPMGVTPPKNTAYRGYDPHGTSRPDAPTPPGASENRPGADFAQSNRAQSNLEAAGGARAISFAPLMGVTPPDTIGY